MTDAMADADALTTTHYRTCPLCEATCGLEITMLRDEVKRIRGDRDDVFSKGFICPKGSTLKQLHVDPDRLRRPMVRRDGELVESTWPEAFAAIAEGLGRIWEGGDRNEVAIYLGNPTAHTVAGALFARPLIQALGTRNVYSASTVDQMPRHVSSGLMWANPGAMAIPDLDRTQYLLMLGADPYESNGSLCTAPDFPGRLEAIIERGGSVVVVDPRRSRTAEAASEHIAIRPGTDAAWLAAIAHVMIHELGAAVAELDVATTGGDALAHAVAAFTPEAVAATCRIDAATTRRIAAEMLAAPSAVAYGRIGTHTTRWGTVASWLTDAVTALCGGLDRPGGAMFPMAAHGKPFTGRVGGRGFRTGRWQSRVEARPEVRGELPTAALAGEIETDGPGRVRALITVAGNPARSTQNSARLDAALDRLEFMVSVDIYLNETTRHADVVLPAPSPLAKPHFDFAFYGLSVRNVVNYSPAITDPADEGGMDECEILARLALIAGGLGADAEPAQLYELMRNEIVRSAVGLEGGPLHGTDPDELLAEVATLAPAEQLIALSVRCGPYGLAWPDLVDHPHGIDLGPLQPRIAEVVRTVDGSVDLAPAPLVDQLGELAASLAVAGTADELGVDDQLLLIGRRHLRSNNSWMHNIDVLVKGRRRCTLLMHPADAERAGLADGAFASVRSRVGEVQVPVEVTDGISIGTVSLPHGWGHDAPGARMRVAAANAGVNSNLLTDEAIVDPISGNGQLNAIPVTVTATRR